MLTIILVAFSLYPNRVKIQFDTNGNFSDQAEGYLDDNRLLPYVYVGE